jgi:SAM-dependent methyltransferase
MPAAALSMVPSVVVSAFAQLEGRCVLVFGSASGSLWERAIERGARLVHVCDPNPERLAEAAAKNKNQSVSFAPLSSQAALALRDGAFDVGIIDNLSSMSDMPILLRRLRRALSPRGIAFVTAPNPDVQEALLPPADTTRQALDYYTLYDVVRSEFPVVRMLGQMPFVGYSVAELAPVKDPEPQLDAGFVVGGTEEPEWFVAAASVHPFDLEGFTVVQLPVADVLHNNAERQLREQLRASRHAERSAVERLARLEGQVSQLRVAQNERHSAEALGRQLEELKEELLRKERWIASVEARAAAADLRADEAEVQVERLTQDATRSELLQSRVAQLESEVGDLKNQIVQADGQANEAAADLGRLEAQLRDRAARIRELEIELQSVTRVGERLVRELQNAVRDATTRPAEDQGWADNMRADPGTVMPADTAQSGDCSSAWASRQASAPGEHADHNVRALLEERARLRADVQAAAWRVEQISNAARQSIEIGELSSTLRGQLAAAERRLQEQEVLLEQLRNLGTC